MADRLIPPFSLEFFTACVRLDSDELGQLRSGTAPLDLEGFSTAIKQDEHEISTIESCGVENWACLDGQALIMPLVTSVARYILRDFSILVA